jgi:organic hydroperoxide reductase OsmC/OhrA
MHEHHYNVEITWTGNTGSGTSNYRAYERNHTVTATGKPVIPGSSDPSFRGDRTRYNPEELFLASVSSCHMLWYLHLCAEAGVVVIAYRDQATGVMTETEDGGGHFSEMTLYPVVTVADGSMVNKATALHHEANRLCFIANSCKFPIYHKPSSRVAEV